MVRVKPSKISPKLKYKLKSMFLVGAGGFVSFYGIGVWSGNEKFFRNMLSPILNYVDPELSHRAAIYMAKHHLIRASPLDSPKSLVTKIGKNLLVNNPVGIAAGFDKSGECISGLYSLGLLWLGSVTPLPQEGNSKPRVFRLPKDEAIINRYGFNNDGHQVVHERVQKFKEEYPNQIIGVNLGANWNSTDRIEDYCKGVQVFSDTADYLVINISSPNTQNLRDLQSTENLTELLERVLQARDKQFKKIPIYLKVAPDLSERDVKEISKSLIFYKIDGLIVSNTTTKRTGLGLLSEIELQNQTGGLSGLPLKNLSTDLIEQFYKELKGEIPIIGVGGIWDGKDAFNKICSGATAIQIYTAMTYKGPKIVERIKFELDWLLEKNGFLSITDAVGSKFPYI